jgi:hypothetical protein
MNLEEELLEDSGRRGPYCTVGRWLASLPEHDREEWSAVFRNPAITAAAISRAFERRQIPIGNQPTQRHAQRIRRGTGCQCPR